MSTWSVFVFTTLVACVTGCVPGGLGVPVKNRTKWCARCAHAAPASLVSIPSLGAVPFFFLGRLSSEWEGVANALACGVMLAASFDLIHEARALGDAAPTHRVAAPDNCSVPVSQGHQYSSSSVVVGVLTGTWFIRAAHARLQASGDIEFAHLRGGGARKTLLMLAIMTAHAFGEGAGMGVAFAGKSGWTEGIAVNAAIGVHNIPEGLAVATVLITAGTPPTRAALWAVLTHLPQALVAVPAFLFVEAFQQLLPGALGFAAGCMLWMVFAELLPDATQTLPPDRVATAATLAAATLEGLRCALAYVASGAYAAGGDLPEPGPGLVSHVPRRFTHGSDVAVPMVMAGIQLTVVTLGATPLGAALVVRLLSPGSSRPTPAAAYLALGWPITLGATLGLGLAMLSGRREAMGVDAPAAWGAALVGALAALAMHVQGAALMRALGWGVSPGGALPGMMPVYAPAGLSEGGAVGGSSSSSMRGTVSMVAALAAHGTACGLALGVATRSCVLTGSPDAPPLAPLLLRTAVGAALTGALVSGVMTSQGRMSGDATVGASTALGCIQLAALMLTLLAPTQGRILDAQVDTMAHGMATAMLLTVVVLELAAWRNPRLWKRRHMTAALVGTVAAFLLMRLVDAARPI